MRAVQTAAVAGVRARRVEPGLLLSIEHIPEIAVRRSIQDLVSAVVLRCHVGEAERGDGLRAFVQRRDRGSASALAAGARHDERVGEVMR